MAVGVLHVERVLCAIDDRDPAGGEPLLPRAQVIDGEGKHVGGSGFGAAPAQRELEHQDRLARAQPYRAQAARVFDAPGLAEPEQVGIDAERALQVEDAQREVVERKAQTPNSVRNTPISSVS